MFVTIFLDIYENPKRKNFINPFCPKHPKIINIIFYFNTSLWCLKKILWKPEGKSNYTIAVFLLLRDWGDKV